MEGKPKLTIKDENTTKLTIKDFVKAVNEKIDEDPNFKNDLNTAVTKCLSDNKTYFDTLDAFVTGLPWILHYILNQKEIKEKLGKDWENFEIKEKDLQELYDVNLVLATKNAMIATLDIGKSGRKKLSTDQEIKRAFEIWKKILGKDKVSVIDFHSFIGNNFGFQSLSSKNMDDIIDCVALKSAEDKFDNCYFWNVCLTLKEQPSKKFIDFMVTNTDFTSLDSNQLISSIIILMFRHSKYLESQSKGNIVTALGDILDGKEPYQEFSKKLLAVSDIGEKIKWETIISSDDRDIHGFARTLAHHGIKIELVNKEGATSKFVVKKGEYSFDQFEDSVLVKLLEQEPELNQWIRDVFALCKEDVVDKDAKNFSLIGKIDSMEALISAKATAIQSFIEQSKDKDRLKKMYGKLLGEKRTELLSSVTLDNETAELAMVNLMDLFPKDENNKAKYEIIKFDNDDDNGSIAQLRSFITSWKPAVKDQKNDIQISVSLGNFICLFKDQLSKNDFVKLLDLNIWELSENTLYGYALSNILCKVKDGCISVKFLQTIQYQESVDFSNLWYANDKYFGECLFKTIYGLIRTSKNYKANDENAIKQAINDVFKGGNDYQWFRDGLKTFFEKAEDKSGRTAQNIDVNQILEELPYFKALLDNGKMKLKFDSDKKELRPEEIPEIEMNVKPEEKQEEAQPPKEQPLKEEEIKKIEEKIEIKKEETVILTKEENEKEEQPKENQSKHPEEKKLSIEEKTVILTKNENQKGKNIANDQLKNAVIGGNENDKTKKSKFPTWAKYLIAFGIAAVAVVAALFGFGVLGALAGTALMVARIVAVLALFAELIYLAVLYAMSQDNKNPGGIRGPGSGSNLIGFGGRNQREESNLIRPGREQSENPLSESNSEFKIGMTKKD